MKCCKKLVNSIIDKLKLNWKFGLCMGWYSGENFILFQVNVFQHVDYEFTELFGLKIMKFIFQISWNR